MRSGAQIDKTALIIERNLRILRQVLNQFHLIRLTFFLHKADGFFPRHREPLYLMPLFDDLLHLRFQFVQIFSGKRLRIKIIIKTLVNRRAYRHLCVREQSFDRFRHHMRCRMPDDTESRFIICRQDIQAAVFVYDRP